MDLKNKIVIVTGASDGIGLETSRLLAGQGARVVLAARSLDKLKVIEKELPGSFAFKIDLRKFEDIPRLIDAATKKFGRIDILINNAGQGMFSPVEAIKLTDYQSIIELNLIAPLLAMQSIIPHFRKNGGGMIVNVSSMVTENYYPNLGGYASTKYALNALTRTARQELAKDNIMVKLMRPKLVETDFGENCRGKEPDALRDRSNRQAPPMDTPQLVAQKIVELICSGEAEASL